MATVREYIEAPAEAFRAQGVAEAESLALKLAISRLRYGFGLADFLLFDLVNRPQSTWRDYVRQHHVNKLHDILNPPLPNLARDKVLTLERAAARGVSITPVLAVVGRSAACSCAGRFPMLNDASAFTAAAVDWPDHLFAKPVSGAFGQGAMAFSRHGKEWSGPSQTLTSQQLADALLSHPDPTGVVVQQRFSNHPDMYPITANNGLSATRIITALTEDGPEILATVQKILGKPALTDNFAGGYSGHLLCPVDPDSGRLTGVAYGRNPGQRHLLTHFERHPGTGRSWAGFALPHWPELIEQAKRAALAFPEFPLPGHDIALTDRGPLFLETNTHWFAMLPQLAMGGMRPRLKTLVPRLAISSAAKAAALRVLDGG